jgi:phosphonoacetaldehyde hydrolase
MTQTIRLAVLDGGGTTVDFGCLASIGAFVTAFAERGVTVSVAEVRGPMGLSERDHLRELLRTPRVRDRWHAARGRDWTEADLADLCALVTPLQVRAAADFSTLVPGVVEAVAALRAAGVPVAGTTGDFRAAADAVAAAGRAQGFAPDFAICADEVPAGRPAPWMVFRCMEALGVYPPAAVVSVGDTVADIESGLNAGVWSVGVTDSGNGMGLSEADFAALPDADRAVRRAAASATFRRAGAHAVLRSVAQLPTLVAYLNELLAAGKTPGGISAEMAGESSP